MNQTISITQSKYFKLLLLALLALIWGSSFILIKKGLVSFGYIEAATLRMVSAGAVFFIPALRSLTKINTRQFPYVVMAAIFGMFLPAYLFCLAQSHVQSVVAGLLNALTPAFAFIFSVFIFGIKYKWTQILGLVVGLTSAMALAFERSGSEITFNSYAILIVVATVSYGYNINLVKNRLQEVPAMALSYVSVSCAGLLSFFIFMIPNIEHYRINASNLNSFAALLTLGVFGTAIAQVIYYKLIHISNPLFTSSVTFLIPIVAMAWGFVDGEAIHFVHLLCIFGILTGVGLLRKS